MTDAGLSDDQQAEVVEIAREEVRRFAAQLVDELATLLEANPMLSADDLHRAVVEAVSRYDIGEPG